MLNYFNYFTEIEERFQGRRGSLLMLSTLDWALIETWREAGVPLEAVLRGIDDAFDKHDARATKMKGRARKVNGLAWCAQSVMEAVEAMRDAAVGAALAVLWAGVDSLAVLLPASPVPRPLLQAWRAPVAATRIRSRVPTPHGAGPRLA